ncbi:MAG: hypothetical protein OXC46_07040 [Thaumarchaeota archaeon]|nr:hypothetical protein [Nitrososphaerota archaeon]
MAIVTGNIAKGKDLYGRDELDVLCKGIEKDSLLLISPRRYGKTSIGIRMKAETRHGWSVTYIDMEGFSEPCEFIMGLNHSRTMLKRIKNLFKSGIVATDKVEFFNMIAIKLRESDNSWKKKGTEIFCELKDANPKLIIIDELPTYLLKMHEKYQDNGATLSTFLHWLCSIRLDLQIRFIVCSSVGINTIIDGYGLENSINYFSRESLFPFDDETAKRMITIQNKYNITHTNELVREITSIIGLQVLFFIQLMLKEIRNRTVYGKIRLTSKIISDSYIWGLLGVEEKRYFNWYFKRLVTEFREKEYDVVLEILNPLTQVSSVNINELEGIYKKIKEKKNRRDFNKILQTLEEGFYITKNKNMITFHNKVLRDLWINGDEIS